MDKKKYDEDLKKRQEEHLKNINFGESKIPWQPCLHDSCSECVGTGIKKNGQTCIHMISCSCPKCSPQFFSTNINNISVTYDGMKV